MKPAPRSSHREMDWQQLRARLDQAAANIGEAMQPSPARVARLLDERARRLARPLAAPRQTGAALDLLTFRLTGECYGLETRLVQEVLRFPSVTPVPGVPAHIAGVSNLRGQILAIADLRPLLGLEPREMTSASRIVVCGSEQPDLGILVDGVDDIVSLPADDLPSDAMPEDKRAASFVRGVARDALIVLDGQALLGDPRLFVDQPRRQ